MSHRRAGTAATAIRERDEAVEILKALADATRLEIMASIAAVEELACTTLERQLPITKSTISYHMRILYQAGLVDIRKDGRFYHYRARSEAVDGLIPGLMAWLVSRSGVSPLEHPVRRPAGPLRPGLSR